MSKINLKTIEYVGNWLWKLTVGILLTVILFNQLSFHEEVRGGYAYLTPLIENTSKIVAEITDQPELPDENSEEFEVSCPTGIDYFDDPEKVARFIERIGPLGQQYPWMIDYLISSNILESEQLRKMLQDEYSSIQN